MGNNNSYYAVPGSELNNIGNAIRDKQGTSTQFAVEDMANAIRDISTGIELPELTNPAGEYDILVNKEALDKDGKLLTGKASLQSTTVTTNCTVTPDDGCIGFSSVTVEVVPSLEERSVTPALETVEVTPNVGYDGFSKVIVDPIIPGTINSPTIDVDDSGKITASVKVTNAGWISSAPDDTTYQLQTLGTTTYTPKTTDQTIASGQYLTGIQTILGEPNLKESNIKGGVAIFGVTGSYVPDEVKLQKKTDVTPNPAGQTITADSGYDGLSSVTIKAMSSGSATIPDNAKITANPSITEKDGIVCASVDTSGEITPKVTEGYIKTGSKGRVAVSGSTPLNAASLETTGGRVAGSTDVDATGGGGISLGNPTSSKPSGYYVEVTSSGTAKREKVTTTCKSAGWTKKDSTSELDVLTGVSLDPATKYYPISVSAGAYSASVSMTSGDGSVSATSTNVSLTETTAPSGYYIKATGSGTVKAKGTATIGTAGYIAAGSTGSDELSKSSNSATKYYQLPSGSCTVSGGDLSVTADYSDTPDVAITLDGQTTEGVTITDNKPSGYYLTLGASSEALSGTTTVSSANVTETHTAGYISTLPTGTRTAILGKQASPTVTVGQGTKTRYVTLPSASCKVEGGGLSTKSVSVQAETLTKSIKVTALEKAPDNPEAGYYFKATGGATVQRAAITDTHTAGWLPKKDSNKLFDVDSVSPSTSKYYTIDTQTKSITPNFTDTATTIVVTPDSNSDGSKKLLSSVTINRDADLKPENIKKNVEIFGVTGSYGYWLTVNQSNGAKQTLGNGQTKLLIDPNQLPMTVRINCADPYVFTGISFSDKVAYQTPDTIDYLNKFVDVTITGITADATINTQVVNRNDLPATTIPVLLVGDVDKLTESSFITKNGRPFVNVGTEMADSFAPIGFNLYTKPGYTISQIEDVYDNAGAPTVLEPSKHISGDAVASKELATVGYPTWKITVVPDIGYITEIWHGHTGSWKREVLSNPIPIADQDATLCYIYTPSFPGSPDDPGVGVGFMGCIDANALSAGALGGYARPLPVYIKEAYDRLQSNGSLKYLVQIDPDHTYTKVGRSFTLAIGDNVTNTSPWMS